MGKCQRCNRELSDPNAVFGWRCAQILGVSGTLYQMGAEVFRKFVEGVLKAKRLFGKSNFKLSDKQWKKLYEAFARMSLWNGIDEKKVRQARLDGYSIFGLKRGQGKKLIDELNEYKKYINIFGTISGTSIKLAKDGKLDDVTNKVLKAHDLTVGNSISGKAIKNNGIDVYGAYHHAVAEKNYRHNKKVDLSGYKNGYINDQNTGAVSKLKLGSRDMSYNGCEVIAAYNALVTLGKREDIRDIAYHFENDGQMLGGEFGTNPYALKRYFSDKGYSVKTLEGENITDKNIPKADAYILSFWNDDDVMYGLHTVSVRKSDSGYYLYNYDVTSDETYFCNNLKTQLAEKGFIPLTLHCIKKENAR